MKFILIYILHITGGAGIASSSVEFNSLTSCMAAGNMIISKNTNWNGSPDMDYSSFICVEK